MSNLEIVTGAGPVGSAVALQLAEQGINVRLLTRSGSGPEHPLIDRRRVDVSDSEALRSVSEGATAQRWAVPAVLAVIVIYALVSEVSRMHANEVERHAGNPALRPQQAVRGRPRTRPRRSARPPPLPTGAGRGRRTAGAISWGSLASGRDRKSVV